MNAEVLLQVFEDNGKSLESSGYECDVGHLVQVLEALRKANSPHLGPLVTTVEKLLESVGVKA